MGPSAAHSLGLGGGRGRDGSSTSEKPCPRPAPAPQSPAACPQALAAVMPRAALPKLLLPLLGLAAATVAGKLPLAAPRPRPGSQNSEPAETVHCRPPRGGPEGLHLGGTSRPLMHAHPRRPRGPCCLVIPCSPFGVQWVSRERREKCWQRTQGLLLPQSYNLSADPTLEEGPRKDPAPHPATRLIGRRDLDLVPRPE